MGTTKPLKPILVRANMCYKFRQIRTVIRTLEEQKKEGPWSFDKERRLLFIKDQYEKLLKDNIHLVIENT